MPPVRTGLLQYKLTARNINLAPQFYTFNKIFAQKKYYIFQKIFFLLLGYKFIQFEFRVMERFIKWLVT